MRKIAVVVRGWSLSQETVKANMPPWHIVLLTSQVHSTHCADHNSICKGLIMTEDHVDRVMQP